MPDSDEEIRTRPLELAAAPAIESDPELRAALQEAAELEHALLIQYLFAAFSLRTRPAAGEVSVTAAEAARRWKRTILEVAREEMGHLALVCNLLAAVDGQAWLRRSHELPAANRYFPHTTRSGRREYVEFRLERFGRATIDRFIRFERPQDQDDGDWPEYTSVGGLYRQIAGYIAQADPETLFTGNPWRQEAHDFGHELALQRVTDRASALVAIDRIVAEGEGTPTGGMESHWQRFKDIRGGLRELGEAPVLPVGPNPTLDAAAETSEDRTPIRDPGTVAVAQLFDTLYGATLLLLELLYRFPVKLRAHGRGELRDAIRAAMSGLLQPVGELLMTLPSGVDGRAAGPVFGVERLEHPSEDGLEALEDVTERLDAAARSARDVAALAGRPGIPQNIELLAAWLRALRTRR